MERDDKHVEEVLKQFSIKIEVGETIRVWVKIAMGIAIGVDDKILNKIVAVVCRPTLSSIIYYSYFFGLVELVVYLFLFNFI